MLGRTGIWGACLAAGLAIQAQPAVSVPQKQPNAYTLARVSELKTQLDSNLPPIILDVRQANAFANEHIPGALNWPLAKLRANQGRPSGLYPYVPIFVYCACEAEEASSEAANLLARRGFHYLYVLVGGLYAWEDGGDALVGGRFTTKRLRPPTNPHPVPTAPAMPHPMPSASPTPSPTLSPSPAGNTSAAPD